MKSFPIISRTQSAEDTRDIVRTMREAWRWDTVTLDLGSCAANTTTDHTFDSDDDDKLDGLRAGQFVAASPPSGLNAGLAYAGAWCANDNEITIRIVNATGGAIDPASGDWSIWGSKV